MTDTRTPAEIAEDERREAHEAANEVGQYDDIHWGTSPAAEAKKNTTLHLAIDRAVAAAKWAQADRACGIIEVRACGQRHPAHLKAMEAERDRLRREYEALAKDHAE